MTIAVGWRHSLKHIFVYMINDILSIIQEKNDNGKIKADIYHYKRC